MKTLIPILLFALAAPAATSAGEATAVAKLEASVRSPKSIRIAKNDEGAVTSIRLNGPALTNEDLTIFLQFPKLESLTISHAGYANGKKSGVDFSGIAVLADHPSLRNFSAGGAVGKPYLDALAKLENVPELYIQTTHTVDDDWAAIGTMTHLTYLGVRVRNDRMSKLTEGFFAHLMPLENLERFLLSEMTFTDPAPFVEFVTTRPKLQELIIRRSPLPESTLTQIREAKPNLTITLKA